MMTREESRVHSLGSLSDMELGNQPVEGFTLVGAWTPSVALPLAFMTLEVA